MSKVIGIGGVFIHFKGDTKLLYDWYSKYLGMEFSNYGSGFIEGEQLLLLSFKRDNDNLPLINFRVDDIEGIYRSIKAEKIKVISPITNYEYGLFFTFEDPFGNIIELWQANKEEYIKLVNKEINEYKKNKESQ